MDSKILPSSGFNQGRIVSWYLSPERRRRGGRSEEEGVMGGNIWLLQGVLVLLLLLLTQELADEPQPQFHRLKHRFLHGQITLSDQLAVLLPLQLGLGEIIPFFVVLTELL